MCYEAIITKYQTQEKNKYLVSLFLYLEEKGGCYFPLRNGPFYGNYVLQIQREIAEVAETQ